MALNFDAQVRLTEALLPLLRESAPSAIVNVASTAARVARPGTGAYSASKAALAAWSDALGAEEGRNGVHVGLVLPGLRRDRGLPRAGAGGQAGHALGGLGRPEGAAEAIRDAGLRGRHERFVPRAYRTVAVLRTSPPSSSVACSAEAPVRCSPPAPHRTTTIARSDQAARADGRQRVSPAGDAQRPRGDDDEPGRQPDRGGDLRPLRGRGGRLRARRRRRAHRAVPPREPVRRRRARDARAHRAGRRADRAGRARERGHADAEPGAADGAARRARGVRGRPRRGRVHARGGPRGGGSRPRARRSRSPTSPPTRCGPRSPPRPRTPRCAARRRAPRG